MYASNTKYHDVNENWYSVLSQLNYIKLYVVSCLFSFEKTAL